MLVKQKGQAPCILWLSTFFGFSDSDCKVLSAPTARIVEHCISASVHISIICVAFSVTKQFGEFSNFADLSLHLIFVV